MNTIRLVAHLTVQLVEVDGDETRILDTRQGSQGGDLETVQRQAHLMVDAYTLGLATVDMRVGPPRGRPKGSLSADQVERLYDQEREAAATRALSRKLEREAFDRALSAFMAAELEDVEEIE